MLKLLLKVFSTINNEILEKNNIYTSLWNLHIHHSIQNQKFNWNFKKNNY